MYYYANKNWSKMQDVMKELEHFSKEAGSKLKEYFEQFERTGEMKGKGESFRPSVDISEDDNAVYVRIEVPGIKKEDIQLILKQGQRLVVSGEKKNNGSSEERIISEESKKGSFIREIDLGVEVQLKDDGMTATYENGILKITLEKTVKDKGVTIDIN